MARSSFSFFAHPHDLRCATQICHFAYTLTALTTGSCLGKDGDRILYCRHIVNDIDMEVNSGPYWKQVCCAFRFISTTVPRFFAFEVADFGVEILL